MTPAVAVMSQAGDDLFISPLVGTLPEMKMLGATWDSKRSAWKLAACLMNAAATQELLMDVDIDPSVTVDDYASFVVPGKDERLFDYQRSAVDRIVGAKRGLMLVASPGLGKTAMAVSAAEHVIGDDQVVIVAPAPLLRTWQREIRTWARGDASAAIIHGRMKDTDWESVRSARWLITSWDIVARHQDWFAGKWPLWIFDESVLAKTRSSQRSLAISGGRKKAKVKPDGTVVQGKKWENLRKSIDRVWLLSGSPTTRHADDLWKQLSIIFPRAFRSYWRFAERYCTVEETAWAKVVTGTRRDRDALADNADLILVINQEDVLDLPEYLFEAIDVDLTPKQQRAYEDMEKQFIAELDSGDMLTANYRMDQLIYLQQIASYWEGESSKHDALIDMLTGGAYETPMLVWTHWREGGDALAKRIAKVTTVGHVWGGMSSADKDKVIEDYKAGAIEVLVMSMGVGKFGHTLTNTKTVVYVDKTWLADDYFQSLRRVRRIGLKHRPVVVTIRAPHTVDRLIEMNLEGKLTSISKITNASLKELLSGLGQAA